MSRQEAALRANRKALLDAEAKYEAESSAAVIIQSAQAFNLPSARAKYSLPNLWWLQRAKTAKSKSAALRLQREQQRIEDREEELRQQDIAYEQRQAVIKMQVSIYRQL